MHTIKKRPNKTSSAQVFQSTEHHHLHDSPHFTCFFLYNCTENSALFVQSLACSSNCHSFVLRCFVRRSWRTFSLYVSKKKSRKRLQNYLPNTSLIFILANYLFRMNTIRASELILHVKRNIKMNIYCHKMELNRWCVVFVVYDDRNLMWFFLWLRRSFEDIIIILFLFTFNPFDKHSNLFNYPNCIHHLVFVAFRHQVVEIYFQQFYKTYNFQRKKQPTVSN